MLFTSNGPKTVGRWSSVLARLEGPRLLLLSVETGATKELTSPSRKNFVFGDRTFAISPDGLKIAFARFYNSSASDLYVMPLAGGEPIQLTRNERTILGVTWTSDGRELVYASDRATSNWTLWRRSVEAPVDSPSIRVESAGPNARQPVIQKVAPGFPGPTRVRHRHSGLQHMDQGYGGIILTGPQGDCFKPRRGEPPVFAGRQTDRFFLRSFRDHADLRGGPGRHKRATVDVVFRRLHQCTSLVSRRQAHRLRFSA